MICGPVISFMSVEAVGASKTLVAVYQTSRCPFHEDCTVPAFVRLSAYLLTEFNARQVCSPNSIIFRPCTPTPKKHTISHLQVSVNASRFVSVSILISNCVTYIRIGAVLLLQLTSGATFFVHVSDSRCCIQRVF